MNTHLMNPLLQQLRNTIESLVPENLDDHKPRLLELVDSLLPSFAHADGDGNGNGKHHKLSPREREVMTMILSGRRLKEIAASLDISVKTVTTHRSRLLRKLGVDDNLGLYRYGVRNGLIGV
jgi:two-component system, NarL family, invasion response regulator UvrY